MPGTPDHWEHEEHRELLHDVAAHKHHIDGEDIFELNSGHIHPDDLRGLVAIGVRFPEIEKDLG